MSPFHLRSNLYAIYRVLEKTSIICSVALILIFAYNDPLGAQPLPAFDFRIDDISRDWKDLHDIANVHRTNEGLRITIRGADPYIVGPARNFTPGQYLWADIRLKSDEAGFGQLFYFPESQSASEANSVKFAVPDRQKWVDVHIPLPPLGPGTRFRIDPPGVGGECIVASLRFEPRTLPKEPAWPKALAEQVHSNDFIIQSGDVKLFHSRQRFGGFVFSVAGQTMAVGSTNQLLGYESHGEVHWLNLAGAGIQNVSKAAGKIIASVQLNDADGGVWTIKHRFSPGAVDGTVDVVSSVTVSKDRDVVFLPLFFLFPGAGSFGDKKGQALFAGIEYLAAPDASSSEADILGPGSKRQIPDYRKITFPLMAIQAEDRYIGLIWDKSPEFGAVFDSPDRLFASGGHVMGIVFPGSDGDNRPDGSLLPYRSRKLSGGNTLLLKATVVGGRGKSVVPAVKKYVELRGVPHRSLDSTARQTYLAESARGWLESEIAGNGLFRHAYWPGGTAFQMQPAADAPLFMEWLALNTDDASLSQRLEAAARAAIARVSPAEYDESHVGHIVYPVGSLVYGYVEENAARALVRGRKLLLRFEPDGSVRYKALPGKPDFGRTHYAPDANGLTAQLVVSVLECATECGDPALLSEGLRLLRALDKFDATVPRGAQTWEIPLHAPDILSSAWLVRAYTLGFELTEDSRYLERARYWAWTGVPFVYLVKPTEKPIGLFATIPVLGATEWTTPDWIGLPVQWCGLVYADALYRLMRHDKVDAATWKRLADGITLSGIAQVYSAGEGRGLRGLLPDSFNVRYQLRNGPAINPATLEADAIRFFGGPELYDFRVFRKQGLILHAPGLIENISELNERAVSLTVKGWPKGSYYLLVVGFKTKPAVSLNGKKLLLSSPHVYDGKNGRLILRLEGSPRVTISLDEMAHS